VASILSESGWLFSEERSGSAKDSATVIALQTNMESRIEEMMNQE
tara:strand:- start:366 stop:500 length:135 start_codon:yes stop_codon:yes gene_type:complete